MSMSNLEGVLLSDYLLMRCISASELADVYYARQQGSGNDEVAIKIYHAGYAQQAAFRGYFMVEAEKIGQFDHANILPLLEFGEGDKLVYAVTPYISSGTLEDYLRRAGGMLSVRQAVPLVQQLCSAVQYAHSLNSIHGNIKLENIFVAPDGRILLADFGIVNGYLNTQGLLSRSLGSRVPQATAYLAPEQRSGMLRPTSDIYALGVLLYHMLTGHIPVEVQLAQVRQQSPLASMHMPTLPGAVVGVLSRALQQQATHRFASAEELSQAFVAAASAAPVVTPLPVGEATHLLSPVSAGNGSLSPGLPPFLHEGDLLGRQRFWSVEPIEWSPLPPVYGAEPPLSAGDYLRDSTTAPVGQRQPVRVTEEPKGEVTPIPVLAQLNVSMPEARVQRVEPEKDASWRTRLGKVLPLIVVSVLVLGLLVAFLSSFFYPA